MLGLPDGLSLRVALSDDREFLRRVYHSTRLAELSVTGWSVPQIEAFLEAQFEAQDSHYRLHYPQAEFLIVLESARPIGRLYLMEYASELRVMDIALLTEQRGQGFGRALMNAVLARADRAGQRVSLHVESENFARTWYERLGFHNIEDRGVYQYMERPAIALG